MTNADMPGGAWRAAFASAPRSAMNVYADVNSASHRSSPVGPGASLSNP